jgi:hypothetical protein
LWQLNRPLGIAKAFLLALPGMSALTGIWSAFLTLIPVQSLHQQVQWQKNKAANEWRPNSEEKGVRK